MSTNETSELVQAVIATHCLKMLDLEKKICPHFIVPTLTMVKSFLNLIPDFDQTNIITCPMCDKNPCILFMTEETFAEVKNFLETHSGETITLVYWQEEWRKILKERCSY